MLHVARRMLVSLTLVAPCASADVIFMDAFEDPGLVLNEIVDDGTDAVELFNGSGATVNLSGWYLSDDDPLHVYTFPPNTTLAAGAYLVANGQLTFSGDATKSVSLYSPNSQLFAGYSWVQIAYSPMSHSRCPNGLGAFDITIVSSLGATNACSPPPMLVINEIVDAAANGGPDAIEFFNPANYPAFIAGWYFTDSDPTHIYTFANDTIVSPGAYLVLYRDDVASFTFGLGSADSVILYNNESDMVDSYTWQASAPAPSSHSRCPDASGEFTIAPVTTLGTTNSCP